jgi:hypothetical protein
MNARSLRVALFTITVGGLAASGCSSGSSGSAEQIATAVICGKTICAPGEVCCNASCGICTPPDGACIQVACEPPPPATGACGSDSDCRTFSDYCTGCDCRALSICEKDPVCPGGGVQCLLDPCASKEAFCDGGRCALRDRRAACAPESCGPQLGRPNTLCPDGTTVAGPNGRCLTDATGTCGWEIVQCPDPSVCGSSPCTDGLEWCTLTGRCAHPACLSCCQFGTACERAEDCGGSVCATCPSGAPACSPPECGSVVPGQCRYPQPICG